LEAILATLSPNRFHDLIDRIFLWRRARHAVFDIVRVHYPAVRALAEAAPPDSESTDRAWLQRPELRGFDEVVRLLESTGFAEQAGSIRALFVDDRCGFIGSHQVSSAAHIDPDRLVAEILRLAANHQASGIVLATNDRARRTARASNRQKLTQDIYRKGEAIDLFLLDHVVLTSAGWKRMPALRCQEHPGP
jgi:DNA repair protein RadC